ncbi:MAG: hypothetical protein U9N62_05820 [Thermotogota bacterium]|nr:hypothetical protein [Thermotogota bacterium]
MRVTEYTYENETWKELDYLYAEYDNNGNVLHEQRETVEGTIQFDYRYTYDENNNLQQINGVRLRNGVNVDYNYDYIYDEAGNQIEGIRYDEAGHVLSRYKAEYNEAGNFLLGINYVDNAPTSKYEAEYDEHGKLTAERRFTGYIYKDEEGYQLEYQLEYVYDENDNVIEETRFDSYLETEYQYNYQYDDENHLIKALNYDSNKTLVSNYQGVYDGNNLIEFTITNADGEIQTKHIAEYDNEKLILEMDCTDPNNQKKVSEVKFDEYGNKILDINYETVIGGETFASKYEYAYDSNHNCIEEIYLVLDEATGNWKPLSRQTNTIVYY